jgi:predicted LPLAT superfamily acyltransferase
VSAGEGAAAEREPASAGTVGAPRWSQTARGGKFGNLFYVALVRHGGLALAPFFLFWTSLYFLLIGSPEGRRHSFALARRLGLGESALGRWSFAFRHFFTFATLLLDRVAILNGCADRYEFQFEREGEIVRALGQGKGALLVTAHLGSWEVMGHLLERLKTPVTLVMYDGAPPALRATLERLSAGRSFRVLYTDGSPTSAAGILAALARGEIVGMMGDRVFKGRALAADFCEAPAQFPLAPYALAVASGAPLLYVIALRAGRRRYELRATPTAPFSYADRRHKDIDHARWVQAYAKNLERELRAHPHQWGNFFDFWAGAE